MLALSACNQTEETQTTAQADNQLQTQAAQATEKLTQDISKTLTALKQYKTDATTLVALIEKKGPDTEIAHKSAELVSQSQTIITAFKEKFPQCETYLSAVSDAAKIIPSLPLAEIESGYHADGKLPKLTDASCYHAKDLLVHPATVQAMAAIGIKSEEQRDDAKGEIEEVIEHFSQVMQAFNS